ncbi:MULTISPECIES: hypothetical protein [Trichocoleus]|uniref:Uncharacterized protein n=1 Tax=Trichocoleus desertorum GB2-A4 TaxID=2933944 RepID=A0ABV0JGG5_9CYAN|nr:hypothetical protein [Trichocoleus sp. FACHB-46]MBD1865524.1 hypothetical protein [Trichocoleus sp. FACHB-46]
MRQGEFASKFPLLHRFLDRWYAPVTDLKRKSDRFTCLPPSLTTRTTSWTVMGDLKGELLRTAQRTWSIRARMGKPPSPEI